MTTSYEVVGKVHGQWVRIPEQDLADATDVDSMHRVAQLNRNRYDGTRVQPLVLDDDEGLEL